MGGNCSNGSYTYTRAPADAEAAISLCARTSLSAGRSCPAGRSMVGPIQPELRFKRKCDQGPNRSIDRKRSVG